MKSHINNYKVSKLIISGDYICTDQQSNLVLLCKSTTNQFRDYRSLVVPSVIFPIEITYLLQQQYQCFIIDPQMNHAATRIKTQTYTDHNKIRLVHKIFLLIDECLRTDILRHELAAVLHLDNLWIRNKEVLLIWNQRRKTQQIYDEFNVMVKLAEIMFYIWTGKTYVGGRDLSIINNSHIKNLLYRMMSNREEQINFEEMKSHFQQGLLLSNQSRRYSRQTRKQENTATKRYAEDAKIFMRQNKRSYDQTKKSIENSFFMLKRRGTRQQPRRILEPLNLSPGKRRKSKVHTSTNLYFEAAKMHSQNKKSIDLSNQKPRTTSNHYLTLNNRYARSQVNQHQETTVKISQIVKSKALQAYQKQKTIEENSNAESIDVDASVRMTLSKEKEKIESMLTVRRSINQDQDFYRLPNNLLSFGRKALNMKYRRGLRRPQDKSERNQMIKSQLLHLNEVDLNQYYKQTIKQQENLTKEQKFALLKGLVRSPHKQKQSITKDEQNFSFGRLESRENSFINTTQIREFQKPTSRVYDVDKFPKQETKRNKYTIKEIQEIQPEPHFARNQREPQPILEDTNNDVNLKSVEFREEKTANGQIKAALITDFSVNKFKDFNDTNINQIHQIKAIPKQNPDTNKNTIEVNKNHFNSQIGLKSPTKKQPSKQKVVDYGDDQIENIQLQLTKKQKQELEKQQLMQAFEKLQKQRKEKQMLENQRKNEDAVRQQNRRMEKQRRQQLERQQVQRIEKQRVENEKKRLDTQQKKSVSGSQNSKNPATNIGACIQQYITFINLMGEAVGKSQKVTKNIVGLEWFTGIYYVYKRFFRERKKIQYCLEQGKNLLFRKHKPLDEEAFKKWLKTEQRITFLDKVKKDNLQIEKAIRKMQQSIVKKNISAEVVKYSPLQITHEQQSFIAMEYVLDQYQDLCDLEEQRQTDEIILHQIEMLDSLYIIAELDDKEVRRVDIKQRKSLRNFRSYLEEQDKYLDELRKLYQYE